MVQSYSKMIQIWIDTRDFSKDILTNFDIFLALNCLHTSWVTLGLVLPKDDLDLYWEFSHTVLTQIWLPIPERGLVFPQALNIFYLAPM